MHRTLGDSYGTSGSKTIFRAEVPSVSQATQLTYDVCNALQEEIASVIEAEGLSLNGVGETIAQMNQLNAAIDAKVAAETTARAAADLEFDNSFVAFSGGLIGARSGLTLANNGVDPINDVDVAPGGCMSVPYEPLFGTWPQFLSTASIWTKRIDATWAVGDGNGGRASATNLTGAKWFHVFAIGQAGSGLYRSISTDFGFDTSVVAANLASDTGWGAAFLYRRIGSVYWDGSKIKEFYQYGDLFLWKEPKETTSITVTSTTSFFALLAPDGFNCKVMFTADCIATGTSLQLFYVDGPVGSIPAGTGPVLAEVAYSSGNAEVSAYAEVITTTLGRFFWKAATGTPITVNLHERGYIDLTL